MRFVVGLLALGAWSTCMLALAAIRPPAAAAVIIAVLFTVPLCSLWEWIVHGAVYHRGLSGMGFIRRIHLAHHAALFPPQRYVQHGRFAFMAMRRRSGSPYRMAGTLGESVATSGAQVALHILAGLPTIVAPAWLVTRDRVFTAAVVVTLVAVSLLLVYVHGAIHTPRHRWIERQRFFWWLDRHHYIHHVDMTRNMNFGLPLCDWLFGSLKPALTQDETLRHPSFVDAKPMAGDAKAG